MNLTTINKAVKNAYLSKGIKGAGITVAIIDSGCNLHDSRVTCVPGFNAQDADNHGTMIAALLLEWLPECRIISYNIKGGTAFGSITNALRDILQRVKASGRFLVNISQATGYDVDHELLINELVARNVPVFAAAGNDGGEGIGIYPSHYQAPICVAALDNNGDRAAFSTFHDEMDFAEVGTGVAVTVNGVTGVYNGTSVACPILLAKAALIIDESQNITEPQLYERLKASAVDLGAAGFDPYTGWGHPAPMPKSKADDAEKGEAGDMASTRNLCQGDSGADVLYIKHRLFALGFFAKTITKIASSTFGGDTLTAVLAFQQAHGLDDDGVIGPLTRAAIEAAYAALADGEVPAPTKPTISSMLAFYAPHALVTNGKTTDPPPDDQDGYVMGADGTVADDPYIKKRARSSYEQKYGDRWEEWYEDYKKWLGHRVYDCNAIAEAHYKRIMGVSIDTKARLNYVNWCSPKSPTAADAKLTGMPQVPGVALFIGDSAGTISHVGFLLEKYGPGSMDWYVLECRGKDYGLVITTLTSRPWRWWGVMSKYFEYDITDAWHSGAIAGTPATGGTPVDDEPASPSMAAAYTATCGSKGVNVRKGRSTSYESIGKVDKDAPMLSMEAVDRWCEVAVQIDGKLVTGYMYEQYVVKV